jgi:hypothetical protein
MTGFYVLSVMMLALLFATGIAAIVMRRWRIKRAYDEMRQLYGENWR